MLAPVTHVLPLMAVRRARVLPVNGRVLVREGQKVNAIDGIAETVLEKKHIMLNVRRALGVSQPDRLSKMITRNVGEVVKQGDVIAQTRGIFSRVLRAPADGEIMAIGGGQVLLETSGAPFIVQAGISGTVTKIIPERGAIVEGSGGLVQGVWGNGRVEQGILTVLLHSPEDEFTRRSVDVSMRGGILLGGYCVDSEALKTANEIAVRGLILGSMPASLMSLASQVNFPIILLEGFGKIPVNQVTYKVLTTNEKRDITINASAWDPFAGERPELFIPLPAEGEVFAETDDFKAGDTVRIQGQPYLGKMGTIEELPPGLRRLPNGIRAASAWVRLEDNTRVIVPLANLDMLQ